MARDWPGDAGGGPEGEARAIRWEFWLLLGCWGLAAALAVTLLVLLFA